MNCVQLLSELGINKKLLDDKKQQTDYKIKYIVKYVELWLLVSANRPEVTKMNFVDGMCNAGIYQDGDLGTSMEVLNLFIATAAVHPDKQFNLFINDKEKQRTDICKQVAEKLLATQKYANIHLMVSTTDVNDYLQNFSLFDQHLKYGSSTVVFVDPYDFGTVKINRLSNLISRYYIEIIFNCFTSDYVRNGIDTRIRDCIGDAQITNKEELITYIVNSLKVGSMKYVFSYRFKTSKNTELYQIIFATPSTQGLEKLKEALWDTFSGKFFHRNFEENPEQLTFINKDDDLLALLDIHASAAKELLKQHFSGQKVAYEQIAQFLTENTMMRNTDFLRSILKPMIAEGVVIKQGITKNKTNYKDDEYVFMKEVRS